MTDNRTIMLGGIAFDVPPLPLRHNRVVYPLCRKLVIADLLTRCIEAEGTMMATDEEFDDLITIAFHTVQAVQPEITREAVEAMPITPPELLDMLFQVRYLTGAWLPLPINEAAPEADAEAPPKGEQKRARRPRK